jgi:hypothetical protein
VRATRPRAGTGALAVVTERLPRRLFPCPHYARHGYDYWQQTPEGRLVLGGSRDKALDEEQTAEEVTTPLIQGHLEDFVRELTGDSREINHRWAGIFGVTPDLLPLVARVPGYERLWVTVGYSGHGNVMGLACGELVAHAILVREAPELGPFDPARLLSPGPSRVARPTRPLKQREVVPLGVGAAREPADAGDRLLVVGRAAELAHARDRPVDVACPEVDDRAAPRLLGRIDRTAGLVALEHVVLDVPAPFAELPAEERRPERLRTSAVLGRQLEVHQLTIHRAPPAREGSA